MPRFISHGGVLHPAKERVALRNKSDYSFQYNGETIEPGDEFIYEGPDREATKIIHEHGREVVGPDGKKVMALGRDFKTEPEFIDYYRRKLGYKTAEEYLESIGYDQEAETKKFYERASVVNKHDLPRKVKEIEMIAGGGAPDPNQAIVGGFGDEKMKKPTTRSGKQVGSQKVASQTASV